MKQHILSRENNGFTIFYYMSDGKEVVHNENSPAIIFPDGTLEWYKFGKLHREDGPAVCFRNGTKEYYINGKLHREDGPAVMYPTGREIWYINGLPILDSEIMKYKSIKDEKNKKIFIELLKLKYANINS